MIKTAEQIRMELDAKIPRDAIALREGGSGKSLSYLQGWYVIARLNEVFGQGNWEYNTEEMRLVHAGEIENYGKKSFVAHYVAKVVLTVYVLRDGDAEVKRYMSTNFSDYGYGDGQDKANPGKAHELAVKEAVTDALKRCAKNLGMSMGLALYDKSQENVDDGAREEAKEERPAPKAVAQGPKRETRKESPVAATVSDNNSKSAVGEGVPSDRAQLNELITQTSKVILAKKKKTMEELVGSLKEKFDAARKEDLSDAQAGEFLNYLRGIL